MLVSAALAHAKDPQPEVRGRGVACARWWLDGQPEPGGQSPGLALDQFPAGDHQFTGDSSAQRVARMDSSDTSVARCRVCSAANVSFFW